MKKILPVLVVLFVASGLLFAQAYSFGAITFTSANGLTVTSSTGTLTIANGKVLTVSNSLTLAGTDTTTMTFPSASATITQTICTGSFTFNPSSIASAASETITQACTGAASTDNIQLDFNASPLAVTGYVPSANGMITIVKWLSSNQINAAAVNNTASAIDPGSVTLNYRVVR